MEWPGSMQPDSDSDGSTDVEAESLRLYNEPQPVVRALCASYFDAGDIAGAALTGRRVVFAGTPTYGGARPG